MNVPVTDLTPGDLLLNSGGRDFGSRVVAVEECKPGHRVVGPRGGRYALTAEGAARYVVVVLANGRKPLLARTARTAIYRAQVAA